MHVRYRFLFDFFGPPPRGLYMFILPLTLSERRLVVLYETVIALALILIDGAVAHLLKAAHIYLLRLYMCTNSNCFLLPVLGRQPGRLREGTKYHPNVSTPEATKSFIMKAHTKTTQVQACIRKHAAACVIMCGCMFYLQWRRF